MAKKTTQDDEKKYFAIDQAEEFLRDQFLLRHNTIENSIEAAPIDFESQFDEVNLDEIHRQMQKKGIKFGLENIKSLLRSSFVEKFNPIQDYFDNLPKYNEGIEPDYIKKLCSYFTVDHHADFVYHLRKHLVRTVACALNPNYYNKQCFTLIGRQNDGKTSFIRWLVPAQLSKYLAENISVDKDSRISLCQNFIINIEELATMQRSDINSLKALFSMEYVKERPPYGAKVQRFVRIASFFASANETQFLTDHTGNVRWVCFRIENINFQYSKELEPDRIWAQAYALWQSNKFVFDLTRDDVKENEKRNNQFQVQTVEMDLIAQYYAVPTDEEIKIRSDIQFKTATDIAAELVRQTENRIKIFPQNIGKAMAKLGFERVSKRKGANPVYGYYVKENKLEISEISENGIGKEYEPTF